MRKIKFTPGALIVLVSVLALAITAGSTYARYATTKIVNGTLTVSAQLGQIELVDVLVEGNIIPGVDIPVNHEVVITDKSSIQVYVYLEVETGISEDKGISFVPSNKWQKILSTTAAGKTKSVYVYVNGSDPVAVDYDVTIPVGGILQVSQYVNAPSSVDVKFTAKMYQKAAGGTAAEVYSSYNS